MSDELRVEYSGKACRNVLAYLKGEIDKEAFVSLYKENVIKSKNYAEIVGEVMRQRMSDLYNRNDATKRLGIETSEFDALSFEQSKFGAVDKIVDAVYDVAYTRIPNNSLARDGQPLSYDRKRNDGIVAERALDTLSRIGEFGVGIQALKEAYFFPRKNVPDVGMTKNTMVLDLVREDANSCRTSNLQKAQQYALNRGIEQK